MASAFSLLIPTKKWLVGWNLIKIGFFKGLSDHTQGTGWVLLSHWPPADYSVHFEGETGVLRQNSSLFWKVSLENSIY